MSDGTMVQLTAQTSSTDRVHDLANHAAPVRPLTLRGNDGRQYREQHFQPEVGHLGEPFADDVLFPPLGANTSSVELAVPFVTVARSGQTSIDVPLGGSNIGDHISVATGYQFGSYTVRVVDAQLVTNPCLQCSAAMRGVTPDTRWLALQLDLGGWQAGERLIAPANVQVNGSSTPVFPMFSPGGCTDIGSRDQRGYDNLLYPPCCDPGALEPADSTQAVTIGPYLFHLLNLRLRYTTARRSSLTAGRLNSPCRNTSGYLWFSVICPPCRTSH
jgi:hypothetical protein